MSKATEAQVSELHGVTNSLYLRVGKQILDQLESEDSEVRAKALASLSPAFLTSMAQWVKQNNVTCQVEEAAEVAELSAHLTAKRNASRGRVGGATVLPMSRIQHG